MQELSWQSSASGSQPFSFQSGVATSNWYYGLMRRKKNKTSHGMDKQFLLVSLVLTGIGLIAVADASAPTALSSFSDKYFFLKQQAVWGIVGLVMMGILSSLHYKLWEQFAVPVFGCCVFLLVIVLIPAFAPNLLGARRWIVLGPISFQPAEFMKLALAMYLAKVAASNKQFFSYIVPMGLVAALIMLEPDLGTTIVVALIGMTQIFIAGISLSSILSTGIAGILAASFLILSSSYRRDRLMTFLEQTTDPLGKGYHIRQILLGLGSGGMFGVGLGQSRQKYLFLPEAATDSIFAVIAEEVGFVGSLILIFIIAYYIYRGLLIVSRAPDTFSRVLAAGIIAWIGGQSFVNLGAMLSLVPLTGIPLPFISYGGSSLITVLSATGILLNISRYGKDTGKRS